MRYLTAGESHGPKLTGILEGFPANFSLSEEKINQALSLRQQGYGRGGRMKIEKDQVIITAGVRHGMTLGSPIALEITNRDSKHWQGAMSAFSADEKQDELKKVTTPRPGHGDLVGGQKRNFSDLRNVLERASARETAMQVAIGNICRQLLSALGIEIVSFITQIGDVKISTPKDLTLDKITSLKNDSQFLTLDAKKDAEIIQMVNKVSNSGDTLGGVIEAHVFGLPVGLGDYIQADSKLDGTLAQSIMAINAFKAVEFGEGFALAGKLGSEVQDEIIYENKYQRASNHLGGFEAGMTNGETLIIRGAMKPIPTLKKSLQTVDITTKQKTTAQKERADVMAVEAASVALEQVIARTLCQEILETFPSFDFPFLQETFLRYQKRTKEF
ncbi:chorismate synthase [Enterococcus timonensis]|uniref:chorismate synthase n=1 Tax=Enterococcus timonensis TaxID=1852364 RepID=UPI0008DA3658|nr:chorismate synthase [Enterococcus timonensis]